MTDKTLHELETQANAMIQTLSAQRNAAFGQVATQMGLIATLMGQVAILEMRIAAGAAKVKEEDGA